MDYPRGWQITRESPMEAHHEKCSWRTHSMLCDCAVLTKHPEYLDDVLHGLDGLPCPPRPPEPPRPKRVCCSGDDAHQLKAYDVQPVQMRYSARRGCPWDSFASLWCHECRETLTRGRWRIAPPDVPVKSLELPPPPLPTRPHFGVYGQLFVITYRPFRKP